MKLANLQTCGRFHTSHTYMYIIKGIGVSGVGVGDTVEIWFFGGLSVGYRNLTDFDAMLSFGNAMSLFEADISDSEDGEDEALNCK